MGLPAQIGRYRILGELGRGAMGTVYRGRDEALERDVAIKVMSVGVTDPDARKRFLREGKAVGRLQHPNIVTIYELGEHQGSPFMALELLDGMDLQQAIEAGIRPDPKITLPIVLQALAGLGHAHENGIVHRDVKPSNIFLPKGRPAKIMDFGVVRMAGGSTTKDLIVGTPNYMSPEQAKGGELDGRSDLFSVGLILYELVTGEKAFGGDSVVAVMFKITNEEPDLSPIPRGAGWDRLRALLTRALSKKPEDRHPDARAMSADLQQALKELGGTADWMAPSDQALLVRKRPASSRGATTTPPPSAAPEAVEEKRTPSRAAPARSSFALAGGLGALAIALLGVAAFLWMRSPPAAAPSSPPTTVAAAPAVPSPSPSTTSPTATPPAPAPSAASPSTTTPAATLVASGAPAPATSPAGSPSSPAPPPSSVPAVSPTDARLERANEAFEKGRYAQALAEAKAVLVREPDNAAAKELAQDSEAAILIEDVVKKARAALKAGDRDTALAEIRRGLAVNPSEGRLMALFREATQ